MIRRIGSCIGLIPSPLPEGFTLLSILPGKKRRWRKQYYVFRLAGQAIGMSAIVSTVWCPGIVLVLCRWIFPEDFLPEYRVEYYCVCWIWIRYKRSTFFKYLSGGLFYKNLFNLNLKIKGCNCSRQKNISTTRGLKFKAKITTIVGMTDIITFDNFNKFFF